MTSKFSASFLSMVFLLQGLLVRSSVGTTESTDILYFGVKVNLYGQTEYQRKFQGLVSPFPREEQISSLKRSHL